jgi:hypothetical protein
MVEVMVILEGTDSSTMVNPLRRMYAEIDVHQTSGAGACRSLSWPPLRLA